MPTPTKPRSEKIYRNKSLIVVQSKPEGQGIWTDIEAFTSEQADRANIFLNRLRVRLPALRHRKIERRVPDERHPSNHHQS